MSNYENCRIICLDGCEIVIRSFYDTGGLHIEYPDFNTNPQYTDSGRPLKNAVSDECPYCICKDGDHGIGECGSCRFFLREHREDLIGICMCDRLRRATDR